MATRTRELLTKIMTGYQVTPADLDNIVRDRVPEDLHLDYKHGNVLTQSRLAARLIREYLSAFANSDGGVLIVGLDAPESLAWSVTGATAPGGITLDRWASTCLTPISASFSPLPRLQMVAHPNGNVLVAAAERSLNLVWVIDEGKPALHIRLHDQTLKADEWLLADLVLGRRQHPVLTISEAGISHMELQRETASTPYILTFGLAFTIENESLSWAEHTSLGTVSYELGGGRKPGNHLLQHLEVQPLDSERFRTPHSLSHQKLFEDGATFEPFTPRVCTSHIPLSHSVLLRVNTAWAAPYLWKAALYLMAKGSPPTWYQLSLTINSDLLTWLTKENVRSAREVARDFFQVERCIASRPVVAMTPL